MKIENIEKNPQKQELSEAVKKKMKEQISSIKELSCFEQTDEFMKECMDFVEEIMWDMYEKHTEGSFGTAEKLRDNLGLEMGIRFLTKELRTKMLKALLEADGPEKLMKMIETKK